jgi:hypothetical protein
VLLDEREEFGDHEPQALARAFVLGIGGDQGSILSQLVERRSFREPFVRTVTADVVANLMRNVWSYAIIFCGHFPDQTYTFTQEETTDETRGAWYVRQLLGAAYGLPYNAGPFHQQLGMVQRTIIRLALPGGKPRPKPGPYTGPKYRGKGERDAPEPHPTA